MSECEDMTTMMAKELMLGIKDNVEDVSSIFKRMALLKPQVSAWSIFSEKPQEREETPLLASGTAEPAVEFTFGTPISAAAADPIPKPDLLVQRITERPKAAARKKKEAEIGEDQLLLFKIA